MEFYQVHEIDTNEDVYQSNYVANSTLSDILQGKVCRE